MFFHCDVERDQSPDDDDDAVEDVVRVLDVAEQTKRQQHESHFQHKHAGEDDVTDLQHISQLLGLRGDGAEGDKVG